MKFSKDLLNNTVSAQGQLKDSEFVSFLWGQPGDKRVLFVGNSITRHGICHEIGWDRDCGMAASSIEKDYVHLVTAALKEKYGSVSMCISQCAEWERHYSDDTILPRLYGNGAAFGADLVIIRIGENTCREDLHQVAYEEAFRKMIRFFSGKASQIIVTDLFWASEALDKPIRAAAEKEGATFVSLGDLGERDDMKAIGLYSHEGVAAHPGDKGMTAIAERILKAVK